MKDHADSLAKLIDIHFAVDILTRQTDRAFDPAALHQIVHSVERFQKGRLTTETLSGVPSIVYGLFGMLFFVTFLGMGFSVRAGALTLSIMILPLIIRSAEEALLAVPQMYREGSFGLGAGKLRTIFRIVLPSAMNGILAGVILSIGRIVGETAALIYTAGTVAQIPTNLSQSARTLSVHMYALSGEGLHVEESYATAAVLMLLVIGINTLAAAIAKRIGGNNELL